MGSTRRPPRASRSERRRRYGHRRAESAQRLREGERLCRGPQNLEPIARAGVGAQAGEQVDELTGLDPAPCDRRPREGEALSAGSGLQCETEIDETRPSERFEVPEAGGE